MTTRLIDQLPETLNSMRTRPLFTLRLQVRKPQIIGQAPGSSRRIGVIPNGPFEGAQL